MKEQVTNNPETSGNPKKKMKKWQVVLIAIIIIVVLSQVFGGDTDDKPDNPSSAQNTQSEDEAASPKVDEKEEEKENPTANSDNEPSEEPDEGEKDDAKPEDNDPLGFNVMFSDTYRNDVTGNWRLARIAENISIEEYALDYYNNYFKDDSEVHIIINFTLNTTTKITVGGNILDVTVMDYVDKEEHDAKLACSGTLLSEYHVNIDTGEIEKIK